MCATYTPTAVERLPVTQIYCNEGQVGIEPAIVKTMYSATCCQSRLEVIQSYRNHCVAGLGGFELVGPQAMLGGWAEQLAALTIDEESA